MTDFNEFRLWKKDRLHEYLWERGLLTTGNKNELDLVTLVFGASFFSIEQKASAKDANTEKAQQYQKLLSIRMGYISHTAVLLTNSTALWVYA